MLNLNNLIKIGRLSEQINKNSGGTEKLTPKVVNPYKLQLADELNGSRLFNVVNLFEGFRLTTLTSRHLNLTKVDYKNNIKQLSNE
jgi:hypothetical protein